MGFEALHAATDAGLDGAERDAEFFGDFLLGKSGKEGEFDGGSLVGGEGLKSGADFLAALIVEEKIVGALRLF